MLERKPESSTSSLPFAEAKLPALLRSAARTVSPAAPLIVLSARVVRLAMRPPPNPASVIAPCETMEPAFDRSPPRPIASVPLAPSAPVPWLVTPLLTVAVSAPPRAVARPALVNVSAVSTTPPALTISPPAALVSAPPDRHRSVGVTVSLETSALELVTAPVASTVRAPPWARV